MKCQGRHVIWQERIDDVIFVDAVYSKGSFDPYHVHASAHFSIVLSGDALEVGKLSANRERSGTATSYGRGHYHALFFRRETRVVSLSTPTGTLPSERITFFADRLRYYGFEEGVRESLLQAKARLEAPDRVKAPIWLAGILLTFPWLSGVPLLEASRRAGVHHSHFSRAFRTTLSCSPREYRRRLKLREATRRLLTTSSRLADISLESGFSDQSHLTAAFTIAYGMPPGRFRRLFAQTSSKTEGVPPS